MGRVRGQLSNRAAWLYSPYDAVITGREPHVLEFGNWGLPYPKDLRDASGREPWWFETGHDWGEGVMYAHGVENRFGLEPGPGFRGPAPIRDRPLSGSSSAPSSMRSSRCGASRTLAGYVITELHDCHWESNGLLDMRRNPRVFHELFHIINADTVIVPRWERLSYWGGETALRSRPGPRGGCGPRGLPIGDLLL